MYYQHAPQSTTVSYCGTGCGVTGICNHSRWPATTSNGGNTQSTSISFGVRPTNLREVHQRESRERAAKSVARARVERPVAPPSRVDMSQEHRNAIRAAQRR